MFAKDARVRIVQQVLWLLLFIQVGIVALLACVPPVSRDALSHHLYVPKLWLQRGGIVEIPFVEFAYYPMNVDLLYLVPLYFGNDILPKLIHFSFALLTAWLIYRHLRDRLHRVAGLIGSLLFLSIPVVVKLATTVYVDLGLIFFTFASMLLLLRWVEDHFALKHLLGAALLCGLALGTKYNALIVFFLLSMLVPWLYLQLRSDAKPPISQRASQANAVWYAALFVLICVLVFSPWMVKNYQWTGNPIYPLYNQIFVPTEEQSNGQGGNASGTKSVVETDRQGGLRNFSKRKFVYGEPWWETLSIPVRVFFQGQDDNPRYFDGRLTPLLFILPFFAFLRLRTDPKPLQLEKQMWLIFSVLYLIYTFFKIDMRVRYLAPIIPGLVILSVYGIYNLWAYTSSWGKSLLTNMLRWLVAIGLVVGIGFNYHYIFQQFQLIQPMSYLTGKIDRDQYIQYFRPEYGLIQYCNQHLPLDAKILAIYFGGRGYYFDRSVDFNYLQFLSIVRNATTANGVGAELNRRGFSYIAIRKDLFQEWISSLFTEAERQRLEQFMQQQVEVVYDQAGFSLLRLKATHSLN